MALDQQSYRRSANAAFLGLLVQVLLAGAMALAGSAARSPALYAAALHLLGGLPIWIVLLLLYHQHRLERIEALETEQLARANAQTGALFEEHADDLQIARRRLNALYKWGMAIVALLVSVYLLVVGALLLYFNYQAYLKGWAKFVADAKDETNGSPAIFICVFAAIGFVAFIFARFTAGMTKIAESQMLRGAAGYLMGNFFVALLLTAAMGFSLFGNDQVLASLALAIPAIMILLGAEVLLVFLLNAYRPRRPGEVARAPFDSRLLGLLTTPKSLAKALSDAINYQFGFEVSRSWFYQLLSRAITPLIAFALAVLVLVSTVVVVQPSEQAVVLRFGRLVNERQPLGPGLHFKAPWPIDHVEKYTTGLVHQISVGSSAKGITPNVAILWTKPHTEGGKEDYLVTAPTPLLAGQGADAPAETSATRTPGMSLIGLQMVVQYRISDLLEYVHHVDDPDAMLTRIAEAQLSRFLVTQDIDTLIGHGRIGAGEKLRGVIQQAATANHLGLEVVFAGLAGVHPPADKDVADAFHKQISALQDRQRMTEEAQADAISTLAQVAGSRDQALAISQAIRDLEAAKSRLEELKANPAAGSEELLAKEKEVTAKEVGVEELLTNASGKAAELIYDARAYRWERAIAEQARAGRFQAELLAYRQSPDLYRVRRYLEVLADGLSQSRKTILASKSTQTPLIRIDLTDSQTAIESLMKPKN